MLKLIDMIFRLQQLQKYLQNKARDRKAKNVYVSRNHFLACHEVAFASRQEFKFNPLNYLT